MGTGRTQKPSDGSNLANLGPRNADCFRTDLHPDLKADLVPVWKDLAKEMLIGAIKKCYQTLWPGGKLSPSAVISDC